MPNPVHMQDLRNYGTEYGGLNPSNFLAGNPLWVKRNFHYEYYPWYDRHLARVNQWWQIHTVRA